MALIRLYGFIFTRVLLPLHFFITICGIDNDDNCDKITLEFSTKYMLNCDTSKLHCVAVIEQCYTRIPLIITSTNNQYRCRRHQIYISRTIGTLCSQLGVFHWFKNHRTTENTRYASWLLRFISCPCRMLDPYILRVFLTRYHILIYSHLWQQPGSVVIFKVKQ